MAFLPETPNWELGIYQLEETDVVQGGPNGIDNQQAKQIANRLLYLKAAVEACLLSGLKASTVEAQAGTDDTKWMTPLKVAQAVASIVLAASETVAGKVELATSAETVTGTDTTRAVHPAGALALVNARIATILDSSPATLDTLNELAAALGDDPNFAASMATALGLKAPLASPALTGTPTAPTPAQFDASTKLANTDFIQRALGNYSAGVLKNATEVLTAAATGNHITFGDSVNRTLTLPLKSATTSGASFVFQNTGTGVLTVDCSGAETIDTGTTTASSVAVPPGTSLAIVHGVGSTPWQVVGPSALIKEGLFPSSIAANGYQKLASGLILQWGTVTISGTTPVTATLPLAFPSAALGGFATRNSGAAVAASGSANSVSLSQSSITVYPESTSAGSKPFFWWAIGN